jgi:hypothetical protein
VSALPERRTRPTIRCLREDLGLELPTVDVDLGTLGHPLLDEARRVAPAALFRIAFDVAAAQISEPRFEWPTGPLEWFEVARLGLREPRQ